MSDEPWGVKSRSLTIYSSDRVRPQLVLRVTGKVKKGDDRAIVALPAEEWDVGVVSAGETR